MKIYVETGPVVIFRYINKVTTQLVGINTLLPWRALRYSPYVLIRWKGCRTTENTLCMI